MTTVNAVAETHDGDHLCRECFYTLRGINSNACPECGAPYNAADSRTYLDRKSAIRVREVGLAQKLLIWAVLASILGWIIPFAFIIAIPFQFYCIFRLSRALGNNIGITIVLTILMVLPLVSLIILLIINGRATKILQDLNIKVGLMGAKSEQLPPDIRMA